MQSHILVLGIKEAEVEGEAEEHAEKAEQNLEIAFRLLETQGWDGVVLKGVKWVAHLE